MEDDPLYNLQKLVAQKEVQIKLLTYQVYDLENAMRQIRNSNSWRVTQPFRRISGILKRSFRK